MTQPRDLCLRIAPLAAVSFLVVQAWASVQIIAITCCCIIALLFVPVSPRRHPKSALGAFLFLLLFLLSWVLLLASGFRGPEALGLFIGAILFLALLVPVVYALTFPRRDEP